MYERLEHEEPQIELASPVVGGELERQSSRRCVTTLCISTHT